MTTRIAVLESQWWEGRHTSVRGLFSLISDLTHDGATDKYHYETINSEVAARDSIRRVGGISGVHYLYVACHGDKDGLHLSNGDIISRVKLANDLAAISQSKASGITGVHLGACLFGIEETAEFVLDRGNMLWIAGYDSEVDWMKSSALDMLFFNEISGVNEDRTTPLRRIEFVADQIRQMAPGLVRDLGFHVWVRKRGRGAQGVRDLMAVD
jgi:hypothetical protein